MATYPVQLLTENLPEQRGLEAIFLEERRLGLVAVSSYLLASTAVAAAELYLLREPEQPIALVLNAGTEDPELIEKKRRSVRRVLSRIGRDKWLFALAVPDVDSWISADPAVCTRRAVDEGFDRSRHERAARIVELARVTPLDRVAIGRAHPEFSSLIEFIEKYTGASNHAAEPLNWPT